jgi:hypothetical protein
LVWFSQVVSVKGLALRGSVRIGIDPVSFTGSAVQLYKATVSRIIDDAFANVTGLGSIIVPPVSGDPSWLRCAQFHWGSENRSERIESLEEIEHHLGCDGEWEGDHTCLAIEAAARATVELQRAFPKGPKFANYWVTNWGKYPSWVDGSVTNVQQNMTMPPSADVLDPNGVTGYALCEIIFSILFESPNQVNTGTCGWIASLGALSFAAPAKAIKMGMRLLWTGSASPGSTRPCDFVFDDQFPGLVPYQEYVNDSGAVNGINSSLTWLPRTVANAPWVNASQTCTGNVEDCADAQELPASPMGLAGAWIMSLTSEYRQYRGTSCDDEVDKLPGILYPGMDPEEMTTVADLQGQDDIDNLWTCNEVLDPLNRNCTYLFNPDARCGGFDREACRSLSLAYEPTEPTPDTPINVSDLGDYAAYFVRGFASVPDFTEEELQEACDAEASMMAVDAGVLTGDPPLGYCNHVIVLQRCDPERDRYTFWSWGTRYHLTWEQIFGGRLPLDNVTAGLAEDSPFDQSVWDEVAGHLVRNKSAFGGRFCSASLAPRVTSAV